MASDGLPIERLRDYLRQLKPATQALLVAELERAQLRGEDMPGSDFILEVLREGVRDGGREAPRPGSPQRLVLAPLEPFLVDDTLERKHRGRISRAGLDPIWQWICRDLVPIEAKAYIDQANRLLGAKEQGQADQLARAFQDRIVQRLQETLAVAETDDKTRRRIAMQIGTPHAGQDLLEFRAILKGREALAVIGSRLPPQIKNLADEQLDNVKALLDSPIARHRDVFQYAMLVVMSRLGSPWQLTRLATKAAESDVASKVAGTPYAVAVDIVLTDVERLVAKLREGLKRGQGTVVAVILKDIHDAARSLRTEMDLSGDSAWARQLAAVRSEVSELLKVEIDTVPGRVRRLLRPRPIKEIAPDSALDAGDVEETEAIIELVSVCRNFASELAISEVTLRVYSEVQNYLEPTTKALVEAMRTAGPSDRRFRQSQVDAAVLFCAKIFGAEYAALLAKAAEVAGKGEAKPTKGEPKVAKA